MDSGVGVGALALNRGLTGGGGLKSLVSRERPNGRDDRSFPSGHASGASVSTSLAIANLDYLPVSDFMNTGLRMGLYGVAGATALARVEAGEHHLADVLAGYALGHFVAAFMQKAFLESGGAQAAVGFVSEGHGGVLVLRLPLGRTQRRGASALNLQK